RCLQGQGFWSHLRSFVTTTRPKSSSKRNPQSVSLALTADNLTPSGKTLVDRLIAVSPGQEASERCPVTSFEDASVWADCVRGQGVASFNYMAPLHYVNVPICEPTPPVIECADNACVTAGIDWAERVLSDRSASDLTRLLALEQLTHFIEDLHQPLHVGENGDRGGNGVTIATIEGGRARNLHALWDGDVVTAALGANNEEFPAVRALMAQNASAWSGQTISDWAIESYMISRTVAYPSLASPPACGATDADGGQITQAYVEAAKPIVRQQIARAAVRLANAINRAA
ncbi:S1/P1 nuclease, partial [Brevundimonas sp. TWP2-3-4b1]|uniref:S1/P1 nuclease n=1 Tax=Brevundimonas sp. TWP2-3-4b1 TaxID=2804580 RepID=UPI003CF4CD5B